MNRHQLVSLKGTEIKTLSEKRAITSSIPADQSRVPNGSIRAQCNSQGKIFDLMAWTSFFISIESALDREVSKDLSETTSSRLKVK